MENINSKNKSDILSQIVNLVSKNATKIIALAALSTVLIGCPQPQTPENPNPNPEPVFEPSQTINISFDNSIVNETKITTENTKGNFTNSYYDGFNGSMSDINNTDINGLKALLDNEIKTIFNIKDANSSTAEDYTPINKLKSNLQNAGFTNISITANDINDNIPGSSSITIGSDFDISTINVSDYENKDVTINFENNSTIEITELTDLKNALKNNVKSLTFGSFDNITNLSLDLSTKDNVDYMVSLDAPSNANALATGADRTTEIIPGVLSVKSHMLLNNGTKYIRQSLLIHGDNKTLNVTGNDYEISAGYNGGIEMLGSNSSVTFSDNINFVSNHSNSTSIEQIKPITDLVFGNISTSQDRASKTIIPNFSLKIGGFSSDNNVYNKGLNELVSLYNESKVSNKGNLTIDSSKSLNYNPRDIDTTLPDMYDDNAPQIANMPELNVDMLKYIKGEIANVNVTGTPSFNSATATYTNVHFKSNMSTVELNGIINGVIEFAGDAPNELPTGDGKIILNSVPSNTLVKDVNTLDVSKVSDSQLGNLIYNEADKDVPIIREFYVSTKTSLNKFSNFEIDGDDGVNRIVYTDNGSKYTTSETTDIPSYFKSSNPSSVHRNATNAEWEAAGRGADMPTLQKDKTPPGSLPGVAKANINREPTLMDLILQNEGKIYG